MKVKGMVINMDVLCMPQVLNSIKLDTNNVFYWEGSDRPNFLPIVTQEVFCQENTDRCHSVSWQMLCNIVIDILNGGKTSFLSFNTYAEWGFWFLNKTMGKLVPYYKKEQPLYPNILPAITEGIENKYFDRLDDLQYALAKGYETALKKNEWQSVKGLAYQYLERLNSCIFNLRYPAVPDYDWNQSVGGAYDPRRWCYVDGKGNVLSDEKNPTQTIDCKNYSSVFRAIGKCNEGYYLLSEFDGFLLRKMHHKNLVAILKEPHLYFAHGLLDGHRVMASSGNEFENTQNWKPDGDANIYYLYKNQWFLA